MHVTVNAGNNRLTSGGHTYDTNGNDTSLGSYDIENHMVQAGAAKYGYAPNGKRVWKAPDSNAAHEEFYFWTPAGQRLGIYKSTNPGTNAFTTASTNVYFGGRLIQAQSAAMVVDQLGSNVGNGKRYYPYGAEKPSATTNNIEKFTGYYRDTETGLDYADQRYHEPGLGRFTTPDPDGHSAKLNDPGSWNRYGYVGGDPVNRTDPNGRTYCDVSGYCVGDYYCNGGYVDASFDDAICSADNYVEDPVAQQVNGDGDGCYVYAYSGDPSDFYSCLQAANLALLVQAVNQQQRPLPSYLLVTDDCYIAGSIQNNIAERDITYQLYGTNGQPIKSAIVTEHLSGSYASLPTSGQSTSGLPGGAFIDTQSILLGCYQGSCVQQLYQDFTAATIYNYITPPYNGPVFVMGFGGDWGTLGIYKTPTQIFINGNTGLNVYGQPNEVCKP